MKKLMVLVLVLATLVVGCDTGNTLSAPAPEAPVFYTVTFDSGVASQSIKSGGIATEPKPFPVLEHNTFTGWFLEGTAYKFDTPVTSDITLIAMWNQITFTVSFTDDVDMVTVLEGSPITKPASDPTKTGSTFLGWYLVDGDTTEENDTPFDFTTPVTSDISLKSSWDINSYTISFDSNMGSDVSSQYVDFNSEVTEPSDPVLEHNTFTGWYNGDIAYDFATPVTSDITLIARWNQITFSVTFDGLNPVTVIEGSLVTKPSVDPIRIHNTFTGWFLDGSAYDFSKPVTSNLSLVSKWAGVTFTVTFDGTPVIVNSGDFVTKPADPVQAHKTFLGWFIGDTAYGFDTHIVSNLTLVSKWNQITFTVTFDGSPVTVNSGSPVAKPASDPTLEHNTFQYWMKDNVEYNFASAVTSNVALVSKWNQITFTVTFDGSPVVVNSGSSVAKPSDPTKTGSTFTGWYLGSSAYTFASAVTGNVALVSKWTLNAYTVTFDSGVASQSVNFGSKATKPASDPTLEHNTFQYWMKDGVEYNFNTLVTGNLTLTASWKEWTLDVVQFDSTVTYTVLGVSFTKVGKLILNMNDETFINTYMKVVGGVEGEVTNFTGTFVLTENLINLTVVTCPFNADNVGKTLSYTISGSSWTWTADPALWGFGNKYVVTSTVTKTILESHWVE